MKQWFTFWYCLLTLTASAQRQAQNWYFGMNAGVSFAAGSAVPVTGGARVGYEAAATVSDASGQLLFYTNSVDIWGADHQPMVNGQNIGGHESASQGAVIVRHPGSDDQYFVFVVDGCDNRLTGGLRYALVDMSRQGGRGEVVARGTQLAAGPFAEKITAVRHANGRDTWIVVHGWENNTFEAYLLSPEGIASAPVITTIGSVHKGGSGTYYNANAVGYMKAAPDGSKLALAKRDSNFELFDFDNATGLLSNYVALPQFKRSYGVEFSASGARLYGTTLNGNQVYQFNLLAGSAEAIAASATLVGSTGGYGYAGAMQRGPDGKIYVVNYNSHFLGCIEFPDALGAACAYRSEAVDLGEPLGQLGLPNFPNAFAVNEWTGAADASYSNPANWHDRVVPGPGDDVFIRATAAHMPVLSGEAAVRDLVVEKGALLTLNGVLTLHGNLWSQGSCGGRGALVSAGAGGHRLGGNPMTLGELRVEYGAEARLAGPVRIRRVLLLDGTLQTNGQPLTLVSAADGTALVVHQRGSVSGAVTVQRFLGPKGGRSCDWLLTSPVQKPLGSPVVAGWPAARTQHLEPQTLNFVGELNNGEYTVGGLTRTAAPESGWWLLGNPYPAPLRWDKTLAGATGLDQAVYTLKAAGPYAGRYASFVRGVGVNGGVNTLAVGEAFFVRTTRPGTAGRLRFTNAARQATYETPVPAPETRPLLALALLGGKSASEVAVYFDASATAAFDPAFDAYQVRDPRGAQLSIPVQGQQLAIQALPLPAAPATTVPLLVQVAQVGSYTFRATRLLNLPPGAGAYLRDAQTGQLIDLRQAAYTFQSAGAAEYGRFALLLTAPPAPAALAPWLGLPDSLAHKNVVVKLYNTVGKLVREYRLSPRAADVLALSLAGLIQGIYIMQLLGRLGQMNQRLRTRRQRTGVA